ncbi:DUF2256 domain-containing protein [Idiomarina sp. MD25a]|uniref:DUF2256 domain-containing protein n=1 Tax=Idiomarina sp. MD25a TaxID=1889913 RepID=UPI0009F2111E|nr:DUF2256 domain-containing protein [Idiomarina sp. MD25a]
MTHKKPHLPTKCCAHCQRPFTWRKKWERDWEHVKYCSKRCAGKARQAARQQSDVDQSC